MWNLHNEGLSVLWINFVWAPQDRGPPSTPRQWGWWLGCLTETEVGQSTSKSLDHSGSTSPTGRQHSRLTTGTTLEQSTRMNWRLVSYSSLLLGSLSHPPLLPYSNDQFWLQVVRQILWHTYKEVWPWRAWHSSIWWLHPVLCGHSGTMCTFQIPCPFDLTKWDNILVISSLLWSLYSSHLPQTLTNSFKAFDTNRNGWIQISYEQFLTLVFSLKA